MEKEKAIVQDNVLLRVKDLRIHFEMEKEVVEAVNGISFDLLKGETLGFVGETGAGKTTTALGIMRLIQSPPGRIVEGSIELEGEDLLAKSEAEMRKIRGNKISMIFQDPMTSLNPVLTVGDQIQEVVRLHNDISDAEAAQRTIDMLEMVGIPGERYNEYPHQFSGGMKQRVVIAIALACNPELLIADEPTTALDVTIQAQVLDMMRALRDKIGTSMLMITHDLGVIAETCDKVAIVYAGQIVEFGTVWQIFDNPQHPYTRGLFDSLPTLDKDVHRLKPIEGLVPNPANLPTYCSFYERCGCRTEACMRGEPERIEVEPGHYVMCCCAGKGGVE